MTKKKPIDLICTTLGASALLLAGACGSTAPTKQLVSARGAFQRAEASGAEQLAPNRMQDARTSLNTAETVHKDAPGSDSEANAAYVAERRSQIAIACAKLVSEREKEQQLNAMYQAKLDQKSQSQELEHAAEIGQAEQAPGDPFADLREIATIRQLPDGSTVITLSSAVLFPTNEAELSDASDTHLDKVAAALAAQPTNTQIRIEGYTDATGSTETNEALSQRRADAVRRYLADHGVDAAMLQSIGRGEADPVATNATEDGRASNRRAELVIKLPEGSTPAPAKKGQQPGSSAKTPADKTDDMSHEHMDMSPKTNPPEPKQQQQQPQEQEMPEPYIAP